MWPLVKDVLEIAAAVLVLAAFVWSVAKKLWRVGKVVNKIVDTNLLERLEALTSRDGFASIVRAHVDECWAEPHKAECKPERSEVGPDGKPKHIVEITGRKAA